MEDPRRGKVSMHTVGADYPVLVMKVRNGTGAKGMGQLAKRGELTRIIYSGGKSDFQKVKPG